MPIMSAAWLRANTVSFAIALARRLAEQERQTDTITLLIAAHNASVAHQNQIARDQRAHQE